MESNKGAIVLVAFCLILAVAGIVLVAGSGGDDKPVTAAPTTALDMPNVKVEEKLEPKTEITPPQAVRPIPQDLETGTKDPRLVVSPVDEPEMQLVDKADGKYFAALQKDKVFLFERDDVGGRKIGGVVVPGTILVTKGLVELFGCGGGGKEHETIIRLDCDIQTLDLALTLADLKRGLLPEKLGINDPNQGSRVIALVQWNELDGKLVTHRSEDLVVSLRREKPMPRVGWTYVGKWNEISNPASEGASEYKDRILAATGSRSLVTTFRDSTALLDNPLPEAEDDTMFAANYMVLPRSGTPVRVIFRGATSAERVEIGALEEAVRKEKAVPAHAEHEHEKKGK